MRQPTPFIPAPDAATAAIPNGPAAPSSLADASTAPPIICTTAIAAVTTSVDARSDALLLIAPRIDAIGSFMFIAASKFT